MSRFPNSFARFPIILQESIHNLTFFASVAICQFLWHFFIPSPSSSSKGQKMSSSDYPPPPPLQTLLPTIPNTYQFPEGNSWVWTALAPSQPNQEWSTMPTAPTSNTLLMPPPPSPSALAELSTEGGETASAAAAEEATKIAAIRPWSAYALFFREVQREIRAQHGNGPGHLIPFGELSKAIAKRWQKMGRREKAIYRESLRELRKAQLRTKASCRAMELMQMDGAGTAADK